MEKSFKIFDYAVETFQKNLIFEAHRITSSDAENGNRISCHVKKYELELKHTKQKRFKQAENTTKQIVILTSCHI